MDDKILIRERNTFEFKILKFNENEKNFENLKKAILNLFGMSYSTTWSKFRNSDSALKISKIYEISESGSSTLNDIFYGEIIESNKTMNLLQKGKIYEVIFE